MTSPNDDAPIIVWLRRDLRLADHPAFTAAARTGAPVVPLFILDDEVARLGAAPKWRLGLSLQALAQDLEARGLRLILRRGAALAVLRDLAQDMGAQAVYWSRLYAPEPVARDTDVKAALGADGLQVESFNAALLAEPWRVQTGKGSYYKVFTPYWNAVRQFDMQAPEPAPDLRAPDAWPHSDHLGDWQLGDAMDRGASVVRPYLQVGEQAAQARLAAFLDAPIDSYAQDRDRLARDGTSGLSENLTYGEISPRQIWAAGARAREEGRQGAETFLKELVWREFATHLMWHTPHMLTRNWRDGWEGFPWQGKSPAFTRWTQGRTGQPLVDAAMRELYVTGRMHNRARMITASYLTKHLLTDWRLGAAWFAECLVDYDPASNAMGWQWVAGCGPDAAPYFRVFNPETQAQKFDPTGAYRRRWLAEGQAQPSPQALAFYRAAPRSWGLDAADAPAKPLIDLPAGRARALEAYQTHRARTDQA